MHCVQKCSRTVFLGTRQQIRLSATFSAFEEGNSIQKFCSQYCSQIIQCHLSTQLQSEEAESDLKDEAFTLRSGHSHCHKLNENDFSWSEPELPSPRFELSSYRLNDEDRPLLERTEDQVVTLPEALVFSENEQELTTSDVYWGNFPGWSIQYLRNIHSPSIFWMQGLVGIYDITG